MRTGNEALDLILSGVLVNIVWVILNWAYKKVLAKIYFNYSLKANSKSITKIESEIKRVTEYKNNLNLFYIDILEDLILLVIGCAIIISSLLVISIYDTTFVDFVFGVLLLSMLVAVSKIQDRSLSMINKVRYYDKYLGNANRKLEKLRSKVSTKINTGS